MTHNDQREEETLARARRQLLITGVMCVSIIIVTLWLITLRTTFAHNRRLYPTILTSLRRPYDDLKQGFQEIKAQMNVRAPYAK